MAFLEISHCIGANCKAPYVVQFMDYEKGSITHRQCGLGMEIFHSETKEEADRFINEFDKGILSALEKKKKHISEQSNE